jgi:2-dehydro-3-deoxyphosphogluconate aldolase/(4S)-4-hydroxy-2-oxoglutarate aldolase
MTAVAVGSDAVKIFPAHQVGPRYLKDLHGPFPDVPLVPSGGIKTVNARTFLDAGALAVTAGTDVVPPDAVAAGDWHSITILARGFRSALT